ncbi:MAG: FG-GAP-like repeat-containing protein, partial [Methylococcales bacterium]|nr:FG-GAP-like repeat-containing protein [Methylococcales bacterium]
MTTPIFTTPVTNPFGLSDVGSSASPTFVDIDGDGDLDALVGNFDGNTLFYQNTGSASSPAFAAATTIPFGLTDVGYLATPTFVDIDGDGDLDALVGNSYGNTLFFQNTGSATSAAFATATTNPFGLGNEGYNAAPTFVDIDGDGDLDAFVGNRDGNTLFYQNTGTATSPAFAATTTNPFGLSNVGFSASPNFVDIDGDGDLDALMGSGGSSVLFYQNTGTATSAAFAAVTINPFGLSNVGYNVTPTFVDIDGDGDLDALIGNYHGNTVLFINQAATTPPATPGITLTQSSGNTAVTEGGATDSYTLVLDSAPTADVTITLGNTNGQVGTDVTTLTFTSANWNVAQTVTVTAVNDTVGEFKHTGVINYTVASTDANYNNFAIANTIVTVTDNDLPAGNPTFQAPVTNPFGLTDVGYSARPTFVDIDGDGDLDALVGNSYGNTLFYQNTGSASSPAFATATTNPFGLAYVGYNASPTFADIDGDGDLDALVGNILGNTLFYQNTGSASSPAFAAATTNPFGLTNVGFSASPNFVDIDGDGDLDALVGERLGSTLFFENTGSATSAAFAAASTNPFGLSDVGSYAAPTFVDIDGDGDLDALIGNYDGNTLYYQNTGTATSAAFAAATTNPFGLSDVGGYSAPTFVDIDADGDLDAIIGNYNGDTFFFINAVPPTPGITLTQSNGNTAVTEGGSTDSYTLVLDSAPTADVVITLGNTNGQVGTDITTLTFTSANWNVAQTVTVNAVNDT